MPIRIGTNVSSIAAQNALEKNFDRREHAIKSLASGKRIVKASDDAAGFSIAENLRAQKRGLAASERNIQDAISFIQVAEGSMNEQNNILIRMRELAIQAASDTVSDVERGFLNKEFTQLSEELDRIANSTSYGQQKLLAGEVKEFEFQVGTKNDENDRINFTLEADARADALGVNGLDIEDQDDALDSLSDIDEGLSRIAGMRAEFGSIQSRLHIAAGHAATQYENVAAAHSNVADADVAKETAELTQANILSDMGVAVLAQANQNPLQAQRLIMNL
tara:strand:- start:7627 stop:8460 length:834 start_codon:yes stop_codon:yes gene_type:complete